jgi:NitT/TauT family transport system substrate-binding protein
MSHRISRRRALAWSAGALVASPFLHGCGKATKGGGDPVSLMFDWVFEGLHAPFFYGIKTGIFAKHGIDLTLIPGTGSRNAALAAAAGHTTFSMVDATVLPQAIQQGADLKAIYCYMPTTPFGICYKKSAGISKLSDLQHHSYGDSPGSATFVLWSLFLKKVGLDPSTMKLVTISPSSQWAAFRSGEFDATYTAMNNSYIKVSHSQSDVGAFAYADHGFNMLSKSVVARAATIANHDLMARFTAAFTESLMAAQSNMSAAVDALQAKVSISTPKDQQIEMLRDTFDKRIRSASTLGKPLGWMAETDWQTILDVPGLTTAGAKPVALTDLFTNDFIHA